MASTDAAPTESKTEAAGAVPAEGEVAAAGEGEKTAALAKGALLMASHDVSFSDALHWHLARLCS